MDTVRFSAVTEHLAPEITETTIVKKELDEKPDSDRESFR